MPCCGRVGAIAEGLSKAALNLSQKLSKESGVRYANVFFLELKTRVETEKCPIGKWI